MRRHSSRRWQATRWLLERFYPAEFALRRPVDPNSVERQLDWLWHIIDSTLAMLWHTDRQTPLPLRWVLVCRPDRRRGPLAFFCTDLTTAMEQIVGWYIDRRAIEVTFEEVRAHLGVETQRQWSSRAVGRTTPCLLGLFSLVMLVAPRLHAGALPVRAAAWHLKADPTFSDVLAAVRRHLWMARNRPSLAADGPGRFPNHLVDTLIEAACYAA
jgi:hypothetical protein